MKKAKKSIPKLKLNKIVIARLSKKDLISINGGAAGTMNEGYIAFSPAQPPPAATEGSCRACGSGGDC